MKKFLIALVLFVLAAAPSYAIQLDTDRVLVFLRDKAESSYFGPQISFSGIAGFGATLPIYTIHNGAAADRLEYAVLGIGYGRLEGGEDRLQADVLLDLVGMSNKLWKKWLGSKVEVTKLPPLKFGPVIQAPDLNRLNSPWILGDRTGLRAVYRFGK